MSALPDEDLLIAYMESVELDRLYADADAYDEAMRQGWIEDDE